jgi:hypothetical protein
MDHIVAASSTPELVRRGRGKADLKLYQHQPLQGRTWIRIIQLLPASSFDDPLRCHLIHLNRRDITLEIEESRNHYYAVSYVWGEHAFTHELFIIEHGSSRHATNLLAITPAVDALLRQFRANTFGATTNLWIDAICLNQTDRAEVQEQVFLMGEIYSEARGVRIWLGPEDDGVASVFALLRRLSDPNYIDAKRDTTTGSESESLKKVDDALDAVMPGGTILSLHRFFAREYFTRRWVLQEAAVNPRTEYFASTWTVPAHEIRIGLKVLVKYVFAPRSTTAVDRFPLHGRSIRGLEVLAGLDTNGGLLDNLWRYHDSKCSDPRDKVVALCGFSKEHQAWAQGRVTLGSRFVEYDQGASQIYQAFAQHYLKNIDDFGHVFEHVEAFGSLYTCNGEGPSWCPNWDANRSLPSRLSALQPRVQPRLQHVGAHKYTALIQRSGLSFIGEQGTSITADIMSLVVASRLVLPVDGTDLQIIRAFEDFLKLGGWGPSLTDEGVYSAIRNLLSAHNISSSDNHDALSCLKDYYRHNLNSSKRSGASDTVLPKNGSSGLCPHECVHSFCMNLIFWQMEHQSVFLAADQATNSICIGKSSKNIECGDLVATGFPCAAPGCVPNERDPLEDGYFLRRPVFKKDEVSPLTVAEKAGLTEMWPVPGTGNLRRMGTTKQDFSSVYVCRFCTVADIQPLNWGPSDGDRSHMLSRKVVVIR